jgi:hypothetical protein
MSIVKPVEQVPKNPAETVINYSQKGFFFVAENSEGEEEIHEVETPFDCVVLETASFFHQSAKGRSKAHGSWEFKTHFNGGEPKSVLPIQFTERKEGEKSVKTGEPMPLGEAIKYAEQVGAKRGFMLYCWNDEFGLFRLSIKGLGRRRALSCPKRRF